MSAVSSLAQQAIVTFLPISNVDKARTFYRDTLGLALIEEELPFALVFDVNGVMLRLTLVGEFTPAPWTVFGWQVTEIEQMVQTLTAAGVEFTRYDQLEQDELGVWSAPGGAKVAWFKDLEGNVLSLSQHG
ncbi:VOC family protein [Terriglobus tenax]|uniref:VOC family protein n=1 Tax=Terriglobus tenax TaxID=1111115 RepID=UPI0021DF596B|nr:VOC family protein [Terriglobus tenax]